MRPHLAGKLLLPLLVLLPLRAASGQDPERAPRPVVQPVPDPPERVSVGQVLVEPGRFDGRMLTLEGIIRPDGEDAVLYGGRADGVGIRLVPAADVRLRVEEGDRMVVTGLFHATPGARHAGYLAGARQFSIDGRPFALMVDGFCATTGRRPPCTCDGDMRRVDTKDAVFFEIVKGPEAARLGCADGVIMVRTRRDPDVCRDYSTPSTRRPEFCRNDPDRDLRPVGTGPGRARE